MKGGKSGQVLIIALVIIPVLFVAVFLVIETGRAISRKIHLQNVADSMAMDGGLWYARCMNIISVSNKAVAGAAVLEAFALFFGANTGGEITNSIQKIQDFFCGTGSFKKYRVKSAPVLAAAEVVRNACENGEAGMALFNTETFTKESFIPSFNVRRASADDCLSGKIIEYFYIDHESGRKVFVDEKNVMYNSRALRWQKKYQPKYFVSRNVRVLKEGGNKLVNTIIEEKGPHTVLAICTGKYGGFIMPGLSRNSKKRVVTLAMTRIYGGSLELWHLNGANYRARIEKVILPGIESLKLPFNLNEISGKAVLH